MKIPPEKLYKSPSKHFLFSKTSLRRLEDVFSVTLFVFQDVLKTSSRRICDTSSLNVFKTSSRRLPRRIFLEDKKMLHWRRLQDVSKTSSVRLHQDECLLGSILWKLNNVLNFSLKSDLFSISSGIIPYFALSIIFISTAEFKIVLVAEIFSFWMLSFVTLVLSSLIFCSAAKAFPPRI